MEEQTSRLITKINQIENIPYGTIIAGKQGSVFHIQCDYYNAGLVTPPIFRRRSEELILEEIAGASARFPLIDFNKEVEERCREIGYYDNEFPEYMPGDKYNLIHVHPDREYNKNPMDRFKSFYDYLEGMPKGKWLFSFEALVPEAGHLAVRFAEEFEKTLNQSSRFRRMIRGWRRR